MTLRGRHPGMVDTGIHLKAGDFYSILATGTMYWYKGRWGFGPEDGGRFMVRIGDKKYRAPLESRNSYTGNAHASGKLYVGVRMGAVDRYGNLKSSVRSQSYENSSGSFRVDIIVWEEEDWVQIASLLPAHLRRPNVTR